MPTETEQRFQEVIHQPNSLILLTGSNGSGKTTTVYAAVDKINHPNLKVCSIEEDIELEIPGVVQGKVRTDLGLSTTSLLRSVMRNDPDVILIDRMRNEETVEVAIQAALTGHLVLAGLNTDDAPSTLHRLLGLDAKPYAVISVVKAVLAQRLVRKLNTETKVALDTQPEIRQLFEQYKMEVPSQIYKPAENASYAGAIAIYELLIPNDKVKTLVIEDADREDIRKMARQTGMRTLMEDGLAKVEGGITTVEEIFRVVR